MTDPNEPYDMVRVGVALAILDRREDGTYVLLGERAGSHGAGQWAMPGGKQDKWEHPSETAVRETLEEAGPDLDYGLLSVIDYWGDDQLREDDRHFITFYYKAQYVGGTPRVMEPHKCKRWVWFRLDHLPDDLFVGTRQALTFVE